MKYERGVWWHIERDGAKTKVPIERFYKWATFKYKKSRRTLQGYIKDGKLPKPHRDWRNLYYHIEDVVKIEKMFKRKVIWVLEKTR